MTEHNWTGADHFCGKCRAWSYGQQADRECVSTADPVNDAPAEKPPVNYSEITRGFS